MTTDYAKAKGASPNTDAGYGGSWWLRSPTYATYGETAHYVLSNGSRDSTGVDWSQGVVPALCIEN